MCIVFDDKSEEIIKAEQTIDYIDDCPEILIGAFSYPLIDYIAKKYKGTQIASTLSANGEVPIYKINYNGKDIGVTMWGVGAPMTVGTIEECIPMGFKKFMLFGTCGVLDSSIKDLSIIVPNSAVREEGTSFHYVKASSEIDVNTKTIDKMIRYFDEKEISHTIGKVWTTDAFYRETKNKFKLMKERGVVAVDMECSAVAAVGQFRNLEIAHFFYSADNLDAEIHDRRSLACEDKLDDKYLICDIAIDLAYNIF